MHQPGPAIEVAQAPGPVDHESAGMDLHGARRTKRTGFASRSAWMKQGPEQREVEPERVVRGGR
ncbi:hypothetical protein [Massilia genomosp. 1]|uniref:Uncharacterized protein n=1 Tax=Massilia genomosp. 1 TaxID=2609280 RepID=A0ABX0MY13_9BURK|nr:hypothetical protein [Massilia genomosp. 1]NHZ65590.1 hypothetical protein [Massilia genomosp. 1]